MPQSSRMMVMLRTCCSHRAISALVAAFAARGRTRDNRTRNSLERRAGLVGIISEQSYRERRVKGKCLDREVKSPDFSGLLKGQCLPEETSRRECRRP